MVEQLALIDAAARPLFILSFRQRDELAAMAVRLGWQPVAARRAEGWARRVASSGASVAVIDARGAVDEALTALRALHTVAPSEGRAILVLVSHNDVEALDDFLTAGATHFLVSPIREAVLARAIDYTARQAEHISGGWGIDERPLDPLGWRFDPTRRRLELSPGLARVLQLPVDVSPARALARLGRDKPLLREALRRLPEGPTAFAHDLPEVGRVVEHIQRHPRSGRLHALIEPLGEAPDARAAMRDLFPRRGRTLAALARDLPYAFERGEIDVLFQPQVEVLSGRIVGVEALARWSHARAGDIGAQALFGAAARAGLAGRLSEHVQICALTASARWQGAAANLRIAVNVTAEDLAIPDVANTILARIDASGTARDRVTIEITESGLIERLESAARLLSELRAAGCRVAIDDFGTGYSSLAYLNALPLDYLKLDKAMTHSLAETGRERVVAASVIEMARSLGLSVIAEGVETEEQRALVAAAGCDLYQGFLCAPALDSAALQELV